MKTTIKTAIAAFSVCVALALTACTSIDETVGALDADVKSWKGRSLNSLVTKLGPADGKETIDGGKTIRQWSAKGSKHAFSATSPALSLGLSSISGAHTCVLNAVSKNGKIERLFYRVQNAVTGGQAKRACKYFKKIL